MHKFNVKIRFLTSVNFDHSEKYYKYQQKLLNTKDIQQLSSGRTKQLNGTSKMTSKITDYLELACYGNNNDHFS